MRALARKEKEALALANSYVGPKGKDAALVAALLDQLGWLAPGELELFPVEELDRDRTWVAG